VSTLAEMIADQAIVFKDDGTRHTLLAAVAVSVSDGVLTVEWGKTGPYSGTSRFGPGEWSHCSVHINAPT
jgi:hypothetical protein